MLSSGTPPANLRKGLQLSNTIFTVFFLFFFYSWVHSHACIGIFQFQYTIFFFFLNVLSNKKDAYKFALSTLFLNLVNVGYKNTKVYFFF